MSETTWISVQERMNGRTHVKLYDGNLVGEELEAPSGMFDVSRWGDTRRMSHMTFNGLTNFPLRDEVFYASYDAFCRQYSGYNAL